ncbi:bifunctional phosphoribosyl-AMP cyclohydrolase/phosphoribosyl-ATP diphosphatase HisIE [Lacrimispora sp. NSJ-141]|uniref:Histidine biosynthesis bifunctional protein HisIE n=1 Tax=Lientehia hominis TaxID=2897778 RepID=A0AAP2W7I9_9FIRM|nr:bifunctional phosphoribosyl-AMP cyclohydrolase/phosphoribosyl-ATP diphosphatase HisIE [Lientehia hominis]MCD2491095.1 bifunctional phosphoribosyl-AMP cyclohydrolase/phosphoribosyl-ATP diphosphatase HisIE [Lientehia hominis]
MAEEKKLAALFALRNGQVEIEIERGGFPDNSPEELCRYYDDNGADELMIMDLSEDDAGHDVHIGMIKKIACAVDIPVITGGRVKRVEDVKKYLYAGAKMVYLKASEEESIDILKEVSDRFGKEKIAVWLDREDKISRMEEYASLGAGCFILDMGAAFTCLPEGSGYPMLLLTQMRTAPELKPILSLPGVKGAVLSFGKDDGTDCMSLKQHLKKEGLSMNTFESPMSFSQLKLGPDGLVPVIVQDYKTSEVLMMAYMNEKAFEDTLETGKMHYYSRSRKSQWLKGETSGHFQYVKSLYLDCDNDTLLAKVAQMGAACHTGHRSCFFNNLVKKEYDDTNPLMVFEDVYQVILDRKANPKEGSYTNYLFDKGIDKILKKVGEEATEIVIAAKNPNPEEIVYELSDFLYHAMVLMAEKGVTWEDITKELANR